MAIAFMRHGQTDWNLQGKVQGHTDIPLNTTGQEQAHTAGKFLQDGTDGWSVIISSPLQRARHTGEIVAGYLGLTLESPHHGLIEQRYGEAEGMYVDEMRSRWPDRNFPGGERPDQVANRAMRTLTELAERYPGERVLAVSHGAYIRRLIATITGHEYYRLPGIENASITAVERDMDGIWQVRTINGQEASHVLALSPPASTPLISFNGVATGSNHPSGVCTAEGICE